ncbi:uncharacterized protein LOC141634289 [Silene latifolia]|uniref:uncharacterized protein LOC141634289 n=1 Tax=Silene latifolia TaxID=37657 RepID=UPI003D77B0FC
MLFWKEHVNLEKCRICEKKRDRSSPKVLRYFPIIPRLQRLFMSSKTSADMRWHFERRKDDGVLRHLADSEAWKHFDKLYPSFAEESRNVRLGLASDGFNPFGGLRSDYSIWPVVIVVYNLPPWMCMKQPYSILSLLIPGKSAPGNNIDVYLAPLIEELQQLWEVGYTTFDVVTGEYFNMRATIMWTINDFPAYANLSGWSTKGYKACPYCMSDTNSMRLPNCSKICFMDHRCFLPIDHTWRYSKTFNGKEETRASPSQLSGHEILSEVHEFDGMKYGETISHTKRDDNWKKKSIFFQLPYWSSLLIRHNLDVMHIEKNVCDNILGTLLDIPGKTKDSIKARHDLKLVKIRKHLAPKLVNGKWHMPPAPYTLSMDQKEKVCKFLEGIKVPDGYSSNFSKCINLDKRMIWGLKSHDCHVILEQLLPFAIRGVSQPKVYEVVSKLSIFFKELCSKTLKLEVLDHMQEHIILTLCEMEKIFLPSFFDIMVHLCVHLAVEAKIAGPVQYRWMYPLERLLRRLKCYVRNKNRPEGSIAEGYIIEELNTTKVCLMEIYLNGFVIRCQVYPMTGVTKCLRIYKYCLESFQGVQCYGGFLANGRGVKVDKFGFVSVNAKKRLHTNEPFVLMSQAEQSSRLMHDIITMFRNECVHDDGDALQQSHPESTLDEFSASIGKDDIHNISDLRDDIGDIIVDSNDQNQPKVANGTETRYDDVDDNFNDVDDYSDSNGDEESGEDTIYSIIVLFISILIPY